MPDDHALTREIVRQEREAWETRYRARGPMALDNLIDKLKGDEDLMVLDPGGPYLGIDGALYRPGGISLEDDDEPALIVEGRGASEVIIGWRDFGAMQEWIAWRGTGGSRALAEAPVPARTRTWLEDTVLAYAVNHPWDSGETLRLLEADAMTTDVRYEVLDAIRRVSGQDAGYYSPEQVSAEARSRVHCAPFEGLAWYGGLHGPFIRTYVSRLAETGVPRADFRAAVRTLRVEDRQAMRRAALSAPPGQRPPLAEQQHQARAEMTPGTCPELPPGHVPGPRPGPVQGR